MQKGLRSSVALVGLDGFTFSFNNPFTGREVFGYKIQYLITNVNFAEREGWLPCYPLCGKKVSECGPEAENSYSFLKTGLLLGASLGVLYIGMNAACGKIDFNRFYMGFYFKSCRYL